jgi:hypothetical protein
MKHIDKIRHQIAETKALVLEHVGLSEEEYTELFIEVGSQWAERMCVNAEAAEFVKYDSVFWGWWSMEWMDRTNDFLECIHYRDGEFMLLMQNAGTVYCVYDRAEKAKMYGMWISNKMLNCTRNLHILELSFHNLMKRAAKPLNEHLTIN